MVADQDGNGHVSYAAHTLETDASKRKCKSSEARQLGNGFAMAITADKSC
jgi:hypothetical protein